MKVPAIKFARSRQDGFFPVLRERVDQWFQQQGISQKGGSRMVYKSLGMLSLYILPFGLILTGWFTPLQMLLLALLMGIGLAGVGMSVMHDACHGAFSDRPWINRLFSGSMYLLGGNVYNWKVQHNTLHHTFTNIHEADGDIAGRVILRFDKHDPYRSIMRLQFLYGPFLYSLMVMTFHIKDFVQVITWGRQSGAATFRREFTTLVVSKVFYFGVLLLPYFLLPISFGQWFLGYVVMALVAGFIMASVFQLAHLVEGVDQPLPDQDGKMETPWADHQLRTTANFARKNKLLNWYVGGLNYQIEHHLFPNICHIHYPAISQIVEQTAREFNLPYHCFENLSGAYISHIRTLYALGKP
ncbi:MAG: fatty acid desaturase family protein [Bacteroidia bacterium]|jgi:linoleoyl-CoA desaturase